MMLHWPLEALREALDPVLPGCRVEALERVDSTNTRLLERLRSGDGAPVLLVAEDQTAGRGRRGRTWSSEPGASLTFSISAPLAGPHLAGLSLALGCAVAEALDPAGAMLRLKWPNDVWLREAAAAPGADGWRKLAGILVETAPCGHARHAVAGMGITIAVPRAGGPDARVPPGALQTLDAHWDAPAALLAVAPRAAAVLRDFPRLGFAAWREAFARRDLLAGAPLALSDGTTGTGAGVADDGRLLVATASGQLAVESGDVSVRPC